MHRIISGKPVRDQINSQVSEAVAKLKAEGVVPGLATLRVGEDPGQKYYESSVIKQTGKAGIDCRKARPNGVFLGYAVVSAGEDEANPGPFAQRLCGELINDPEMRKFAYIPNHVTEENPPAFIWHTATDPAVPVVNALRMSKALSAKKVPFELHIYPFGAHGLATSDAITNRPDELGPDEQYDRTWLYAAGKWLQRMLLDE